MNDDADGYINMFWFIFCNVSPILESMSRGISYTK